MKPQGLTLLTISLVFGLASCATVAEMPRWGPSYLGKDAEWYATDEARAVADNVLAYQSRVGAWPKNWDLAAPATADEINVLNRGGKANTIDNDGTTLPMRFIALMAEATGDSRYAESFRRGLDYLLSAQYENGGWPQYFPLRKGYYSHVTFNDDAMMNVMFLLRDVAEENEPYLFVDAGRVKKAALAVDRGIDCILKTQIRQDGNLAGWAAQYDEKTLEPAWARTFEPPSLSGAETVPIVSFLMEIEQPTPAQVAAIEGAIAWLKSVAIHGVRYHTGLNAQGVEDAWTVPDESAGPLWARFYELGTNRPIFLGRDSVVQYSLDMIERERRAGYAYYGAWGISVVTRDFPKWQRNHSLRADGSPKE